MPVVSAPLMRQPPSAMASAQKSDSGTANWTLILRIIAMSALLGMLMEVMTVSSACRRR